MIRGDQFRRSSSHVTYVSTGKDVSPSAGQDERMHWTLAGMVEDKFNGEPASAYEIYKEVTYPFGRLSQSDTLELLKAAKKEGYLK